MIKRYKIKFGRHEADQFRDNLDDVKELVYDPERYVEANWDSIIEAMNENYNGFEFNGREWSCSEVLSFIDEDYVNDWARSEADYRCEEDLPYEFDDQLEDMKVGDSVEIPETNTVVELVEEIPETPEEMEELGSSFTSILTEATDLL